jgi:hypothetical protein
MSGKADMKLILVLVGRKDVCLQEGRTFVLKGALKRPNRKYTATYQLLARESKNIPVSTILSKLLP